MEDKQQKKDKTGKDFRNLFFWIVVVMAASFVTEIFWGPTFFYRMLF